MKRYNLLTRFGGKWKRQKPTRSPPGSTVVQPWSTNFPRCSLLAIKLKLVKISRRYRSFRRTGIYSSLNVAFVCREDTWFSMDLPTRRESPRVKFQNWSLLCIFSSESDEGFIVPEPRENSSTTSTPDLVDRLFHQSLALSRRKFPNASFDRTTNNSAIDARLRIGLG